MKNVSLTSLIVVFSLTLLFSCNKANKPVKCKKKILKMLEDWKQREVEAKIKFQGKMRGEIAQAKKREGKI